MKEIVGIIGAGPGGITAALQLRRYSIDLVLIEKDQVGGLAKNANRIHNYPGFPGGISGRDFISLLETQIKEFNITITRADINNLDYSPADRLYTLSGDGYETRASLVIVAAGTRPVKPGHLNLPRDTRILFEVYPLLEVSGREIIIVGAGDAAFDYALSLAGNNSVTILNRSSRIKALPALVNEVNRNKVIKYCENSSVQNVEINDRKKLVVYRVENGRVSRQEIDYLVFALGRIPNKDFFSPYLQKEERNLQAEQSLYIVGDQANDRFRQISIAAGDGMKAAMQIFENYRKRGVLG